MAVTSFEVPIGVAKAPETSARLVSLDVFRGATIAAMILVNNPGGAAYWPLRHAKWNGWTPTDLIFPFFLFIVGVSLVFSFQSRLRRGDSTRSLVLHTVKRSLTIFALGLLLNGNTSLNLAIWRIPGVLQRIAVAYFAAAIIALYCKKTYARVLWIAAFLGGYWLLMRYVPVPGYGIPGRDIPFLHPDANLAAYLDRKFMTGHLYEGTRDPEGMLSTLPAIATTLCGVLTGQWLSSKHSRPQKMMGMLAMGAAGLVLGELWSFWFPINKNLWTSSYVLFTAGAALLCLAICYWIMDIKHQRSWWTTFFVIFGTNAIAAYVFSELVGMPFRWQDYVLPHFTRMVSPAMASLLYSLTVVGLCFLPVWWMYRRKIFLKA